MLVTPSFAIFPISFILFFAANCRGERGMMAASILSFFCEHFPSFGVFAHVEGVCDTPLHIYYLFVGEAVMDGVGL